MEEIPLITLNSVPLINRLIYYVRFDWFLEDCVRFDSVDLRFFQESEDSSFFSRPLETQVFFSPEHEYAACVKTTTACIEYMLLIEEARDFCFTPENWKYIDVKTHAFSHMREVWLVGWANGCCKLELNVLRNHALAQLCGGNTLYSVLKLVIGNTKTLVFPVKCINPIFWPNSFHGVTATPYGELYLYFEYEVVKRVMHNCVWSLRSLYTAI